MILEAPRRMRGAPRSAASILARGCGGGLGPSPPSSSTCLSSSRRSSQPPASPARGSRENIQKMSETTEKCRTTLCMKSLSPTSGDPGRAAAAAVTAAPRPRPRPPCRGRRWRGGPAPSCTTRTWGPPTPTSPSQHTWSPGAGSRASNEGLRRFHNHGVVPRTKQDLNKV